MKYPQSYIYRWVQLLALLSFAIFLTRHVSANERSSNNLLVQGFLENKDIRISSDNNLFYETSVIPFEVRVLDCQWQIKLGTRNPRVFDYCIISSDGEDCYLLFNYETRLKNAASKKIMLPDNIGDGTVAKGMIPRFSLANEAGVLWLAYASDCFFQKQTTSSVSVPFTVYVRPQPILTGHAVIEESASLYFDSNGSRLPSKAFYYLTNLTIEGYWEGDAQGHPEGPLTNVVFEVLSFTNINDLKIAKEAKVSIIRPNPRNYPRMVEQVCLEYKLVATNVVIDPPIVDFRPQLPGKTLITDQRFNEGTNFGFAYFRSNVWATEMEAKKSPAYTQAYYQRQKAVEASKTAQNSGAPKIRAVILVVLASTTLIFWLAYYLTNRRRR